MISKGRKKYIATIVPILVLLLVGLLQANIRFFSIVQQVCNSYRVPVVMNEMQLQQESAGLIFNLFLKSRRNNFEEVMMVGYIGAAQAMARTGVKVSVINITISIPKADNMLIMTTAPAELVERLRVGKIKSSVFMRQIQWN